MLPDGQLAALFVAAVFAMMTGVAVSIASGSRRWGMAVFVGYLALYQVIKAAIHGIR